MTHVLVSAEDVTPEIEAAIIETLGWFEDEARLSTQEFIDRLCDTYADTWDIESYDNPAVRKIMRIAREARVPS